MDERFETREVNDDSRPHGEAFVDDDAVRGEHGWVDTTGARDRDAGQTGARREGRRWNR
jgi:hypothetical protein